MKNNDYNAIDLETNTWDNGYPSGGNYWGDYTGVDNYHGPNQTIPGSDGIGDTPYNIPGVGNNKDKYPVMQSNGWLNHPPENVTLEGPTSGRAEQVYNYTSSADDPDGHSIYYKFDWGDGNFSDWLGPYPSGTEASDSHSWKTGTYEIKVKAKDTRGLESDWATLEVTMPRDKAIANSLLLWFLERFPLLERLLNLL